MPEQGVYPSGTFIHQQLTVMQLFVIVFAVFAILWGESLGSGRKKRHYTYEFLEETMRKTGHDQEGNVVSISHHKKNLTQRSP
jgi:hypothetical protein